MIKGAHSHINNMPPEIILYGGTGQAKVIRPIVEYYGSKVVAVFDDTKNLTPPFRDVPLFEGKYLEEWLSKQNKHKIGFCITIGNPHGRVRIRFHNMLMNEGLKPVTIAHPTAYISENAVIGEGTQIMAGAIIMPEAIIGRQCIINTKASIDHECILEDGVEIAPGATLCGSVKCETNSWVCAGATVLPRVTIGCDAIVGAGAVVVNDIPATKTYVGIPAKEIKRSRRNT
ncbi:MAG: acetyltransferase [Nitrospirota bacterium]